MANVRITQRRSAIGRPPTQRRTLRALGLRRIGHSVVRPDTPDLRGMIVKVRHLVDVTGGPGGAETKREASGPPGPKEGR